LESSLKYLSLFETLSDAIVIINKFGIIEDINKACIQLFGFEKSEFLGQNVKLIMPSPHKENHDQYLKNYLSTGKGKIIGIGREVQAQKKDGTLFPIRLSISKFIIEDELYFTGIIHDLTTLKNQEEIIRRYSEELELMVRQRTKDLQKEVALKEKAEEALKRSQELYQTISKNYPNGAIIVVNRSGIIEFAEGTQLKPLGRRSTDILHSNFFELIPAECIERIKSEFSLVYGGNTAIFEMNIEEEYYNFQAVPLKEMNGYVSQILLVKTNITSQKRAEKDMYAALNRERELSELKNNFVSTASHEFRTPLTSIGSSASLIERFTESAQNEDRLRHTQKIKSNVKHLTQILNDFLSLEKIESGVLEKKQETINISDFIENILEDFQILCKKEQKLIYHKKIKKETYTLNSDMLKNVLFNLISNAIKYSDQDITISVTATENLIISIRDQGIGISESDQKHLFERFYRASNASNIQGTGLGLNIVKSYLDNMNGSITFDSQLGKGSTFTITLHDKNQKQNSRN
jgi:PAS domain S-box-containing protein